MHLRSLLWLLVCASTAGCFPELTSVEVTQDTTPPDDHEVTATNIRLTQGNAVALSIIAFDEDGDAYDDVAVFADQYSDSPIVDVFETVNGPEGATQVVLRTFQVGSQDLTVTANSTDGEVVIKVDVVPQQP